MKQDIQVSVSKEVYEFGGHLERFVGAIAQAAKDGVQVTDVVVIASAAMADLLPAISAIQGVKDDVKAELPEAIRAMALKAEDLVLAVLK